MSDDKKLIGNMADSEFQEWARAEQSFWIEKIGERYCRGTDAIKQLSASKLVASAAIRFMAIILNDARTADTFEKLTRSDMNSHLNELMIGLNLEFEEQIKHSALVDANFKSGVRQ